MKTYLTKITSFLTGCLLTVTAMSGHAANYQSLTVGGSQTALDGAITVNLIQAGQSTLASWSATAPTSGWSTNALIDGSAAANANLAYYPAANLPATMIFKLNTNNLTGGSTNGYDITAVEAITGWVNSNFANQNFQLLLSIHGGPYVNYGNCAATTAINGGNNSIVNIATNSTGAPLARGVTGIEYVFSTYQTVIHELQAFGTPTPAVIPVTTNSQPVPYRIEVVGDSISVGDLDNPNWTLPFNFGFRSGLEYRLATNGTAFQFVGNSPEPWNNSAGTVANVPTLDLRALGQNHCQAYGGKGTAFVYFNINSWITVDQPDVMLLMIGINDIAQGSSAEPTGPEQNISNIVATVVNNSPKTHVIVAQITPYATYTPAIVLYNNYISNMVASFVTQGASVTMVNQYTNLLTNGWTDYTQIDPTKYANGINHPVNSVYDQMAQTWYQGIQALGLTAAPPLPVHNNLVVNGDFEWPAYPVACHIISPIGANWNFTPGSSGAGAGIDVGLAYGVGGSLAYSGAQRACLESSGNSTVIHLSQVISNFVVGQTYQLSFAAESIAGFSGGNPFKVQIINSTSTNLLFGGSFITPTTNSYTVYSSAPFVASNTVMTLDFFDGALSDVAHVSWIDNVDIYAMPDANLVVNGGFESPPIGNNVSAKTAITGASWTYSGNGGIDHGDPYASTDGGAGLDYSQQGCLQSDGTIVTHISQVVSNFVVGQYYQLSFGSKAITGFSGTDPFQVAIISGTTTNLLFGGSYVWPRSDGYTYFTSDLFMATNTTMTLDFFDSGLESGATYVSWIDNVGIYAVPNPVVISAPQAGASQTTFDGDIAVNLVQAGQSSLASVTASTPGSTWATAGLNDGSAAANANLTYYPDSSVGALPATITFALNTNSLTGGSPGGYTVTNIQAIAGWANSYLANMSFQLLLSINGGAYANYGTYYAFSYLNYAGNGNNSVLETLTGNAAPIASGVTGVQFVFQNLFLPTYASVQSGSGGTVLHEIQVFGTPDSVLAPVPNLLTNTLPVLAANTVGDQVVFTAAFTNTAPFNLQWQFISGGVTNNLTGQTNSTLTLNNLQLTNSGAYQLMAANATNGLYVAYSTASTLTVLSVPAAANNVITELAAQTGAGPDALGSTFTPTWTVTTNGSLIAGQSPSSSAGNFSLEAAGRSVNSLTAGGSQSLTEISGTAGNTTSTNYVTCGNGSGAGSTVVYTLTGAANGYNLTNITVYGGWSDNGRDQQAYTVYYSTVAAPTNFILLGIVNYTPTSPLGQESATRVTLVPGFGVLAGNVAAVMFNFTSPASENGYCGYSQITMFGTAASGVATTTTLISSANPSIQGSNVTFTATVQTNSVTAAGSTGTVVFMDNGLTLGNGGVTSGQAVFSTSALSGGTHSITTFYTGDANFGASPSASLSQVVNFTTPILRILPVGDSITDGYSTPAYVPGGYRTILTSLLNALNYNVIDTGLLNENSPAGTTIWHEGHDGANIAGVNYCMRGVFDSTADPDIILLLLGTNDYGQGIGTGATNRLDAMISNLATNRPNAKIIVANLLLRTDNATIDAQITNTFNPFIPGIVAAHAALGQQVYFIDMRSALTAADLSSDGLHPTAAGYAKMAAKWLSAITNVLGVYGATNAPVISHVVSPGGLTNVVVTFSKPVSGAAASVANFTLSGGTTITGATLDAATMRVVTLTTSPLTQNASYTLTVSNVVDMTPAQTPIATGTTATFNACGARGATNNVAEAAHFQLAYSLDIPNNPNYTNGVTYTVDNHVGLGAFGRVAYYLELQATNGGALQYMWVSMNPFTTNLTQIGVPTVASGANFQQNVTNMNVASSMAGIVTGTNLSGGNLQFWPYNYTANPSSGVYDWGCQNSGNGNYGAMQIANPNASQMLLSFNAWGGVTVAAADLGIGNNTVYQTGNAATIDALTDIQLDWTFRTNAPSYTVKTLQVFIQPVPVPGVTNIIAILGGSTTLGTSNLIALAGNPANYPLTVTAVSATSTNGSAVSLSGGNISYTATTGGVDQFTYTLSDGNGGTATGIVTVTIDHPPVAINFALGALSGTPVTVDIIGGKYAPTDVDGNALLVSAVQNPSAQGGAVTTDGTNVTYTALGSFTGPDTFTYTVSDGFGGAATATVTVNVASNGAGYNLISGLVNNGDGTYSIKYAGIPGSQYALDTTASLTLPITWTPVITNTAASNGTINFNFNTGDSQGYFRTRYVAP